MVSANRLELLQIADAVAREKLIERDLVLEASMEAVRTAVTLARAVRQEKNLKVRQPLASLIWVLKDEDAGERLKPFLPILADEINVRDVKIIHDDRDLVDLSATANFKSLGKRVGAKMKDVAAAVMKMTPDEIRAVEAGGSFMAGEFDLTPEDIMVKRTEREGLAIQSDGVMTVALDIHLTSDLISEGMARDIVHSIQNMRKESGYEITDRILVSLNTASTELEAAVHNYKNYICRETLALELTLNGSTTDTELKTGEHTYSVTVSRTEASTVQAS